jgi:hypothetical protein
MRTIRATISSIFLFLLPFCSFGWGVLGHRIVGQIAESYLTPKARIAIQKILGGESIAMVSNWADFIKSDSAYQYIYNWHFIDVDSGLTKTDCGIICKKILLLIFLQRQIFLSGN